MESYTCRFSTMISREPPSLLQVLSAGSLLGVRKTINLSPSVFMIARR